jgi:hypothetical protein
MRSTRGRAALQRRVKPQKSARALAPEASLVSTRSKIYTAQSSALDRTGPPGRNRSHCHQSWSTRHHPGERSGRRDGSKLQWYGGLVYRCFQFRDHRDGSDGRRDQCNYLDRHPHRQSGISSTKVGVADARARAGYERPGSYEGPCGDSRPRLSGGPGVSGRKFFCCHPTASTLPIWRHLFTSHSR